MSTSEELDRCDFCIRLSQPPSERPWYDFYPLEVAETFTVVPALGPVVPGHVLIVANRHVPSMARLSPRESEALDALVRRWRGRLSETFKSDVIAFEHGSSDLDHTAGACIVHAHWQMVPLTLNSPIELGEDNPCVLADLPQLFPNGEYLFVMDRFGARATAVGDRHEPHLFRRRLLQSVGRHDELDYLTHPNLDALEATIRAFDRGERPDAARR